MVAFLNPGPQHDHHCILVVQGAPRRIVHVQMPHIVVACENGCCQFAICTTGMNFDGYCVAAAMNDFARAARAERGLPVETGSEARN